MLPIKTQTDSYPAKALCMPCMSRGTQLPGRLQAGRYHTGSEPEFHITVGILTRV